MYKIHNVNNNKTADICFYYYIDEIIQLYVKKQIKPSCGQPPLLEFFMISIIEKKWNETYVEFDFTMGTVHVIFSFF